MTGLQRFLDEGRLRRQRTSVDEIRSLLAVAEIMGDDIRATADHLDACRSKRNTVDYDGIGIATERDVSELVEEAEHLKVLVSTWLRAAHPELLG